MISNISIKSKMKCVFSKSNHPHNTRNYLYLSCELLLLCFLLLGIRGTAKLANCWPRSGLGYMWGPWVWARELSFLLLPLSRRRGNHCDCMREMGGRA